MAPRQTSPMSTDDEAPETFSFGSGKKAAKGAQDVLQQFQAAEKSKRKEQNRARDRVLKERKEQAKDVSKKGRRKADSKLKGSEETAGDESEEELEEEKGGRGQSELEARMERAMREAEEESDASGEDGESGHAEADEADEEDSQVGGSDLDGEDEEDSMTSDSEGSESGVEESSPSDDDDADEEEEEEDNDNEEDDRPPRPTGAANKNYLPDHLFKSALSKAPVASSSKRKLDASGDSSRRPPRKRKRPSKDIVVGSRTIRTLSNPSSAVPSATPRALLPPARVNKFLKRSLNLKGSAADSKTKGWERRPANVGIMKRNGPAAGFVRNR